jgi:hypothetical protein
VLAELQEKASGMGFALAGGTSLALRFGHRVSVDLDFFTGDNTEPADWLKYLKVGPEAITGIAEGTLQLVVHGIKVEFLRHAYPILSEPETIDQVKMWSIQDVAAMKLNAIANRGSKKDFCDLAALLDRIPLDTMIGYYKAKYQPYSLLMVIRSLAWFDDAESEPDPILLGGHSWSAIKERVSTAIRLLE